MQLQAILIAILSYAFIGTQPANATNRHDGSTITITAPPGPVKGSILTSAGGRPIYAFRGIRFAWAPRFQSPVPITKWNGTYDATQDGPSCPQVEIEAIDEECLFLNVYSSKLPEHGKNPRKPVIVYIYSGGYYVGVSSSRWVGPQYLMDQDIVLVTINYRIGVLGFLNTGDKYSPGNYGLKDQVVALRWVRNNIAAFGGNPNLVTISGYSSGGFSNTLHLVSPMAQGLFHRAIIMSSAAYSDFLVPRNLIATARRQAEFVGCPNDTSANIVNCLKTKSTKELVDSYSRFSVYSGDPEFVWRPVIEPNVGQERYLSEDPLTTVQCGRFAKVPIMIGITEYEVYQLAYDIVGNATLLKEYDENFETLAPLQFRYESGTERSKYISRQLRKFYLGEGHLTNSSLNGLGELFSDAVIGFEVNKAAKLLSANNPENVYYYCLTYSGRYSWYYLPGTQTPIGAVHLDDLIYLFYTFEIFPKFNTTDPEYAVMRRLTKMHANFALTGNPTPTCSSEFDNVQWQPFTNRKNKYLDIGSTLVMKQNLYKKRYDEWYKLFPLLGCHH